jgi:hypothetical protein
LIRFPSDRQRHAIIGATGSGKTQAALWHLSHRHFEAMPWIVYNFKQDESIDAIPYAKDLAVEEIPTLPGIYITRPIPEQDDEEVAAQMWAVWHKGGTGVYIDEGYMIGKKNKAFRALLTQGRSRSIPMIVLSQRPVWMDRFVFSESDFFQVFRLQHLKDRQAVSQFVPANLEQRLPDFHSWYYDVGANQCVIMRPVPNIEVIHDTFERRLGELERARKKVV